MNKKEFEAIEKLAKYVGINKSEIENNLKHNYFTVNTGRNGKTYAWYFDEMNNAICDIETKEIITDKKMIERLFC